MPRNINLVLINFCEEDLQINLDQSIPSVYRRTIYSSSISKRLSGFHSRFRFFFFLEAGKILGRRVSSGPLISWLRGCNVGRPPISSGGRCIKAEERKGRGPCLWSGRSAPVKLVSLFAYEQRIGDRCNRELKGRRFLSR